jgi:hypothetical protein
LEGAEAQLSGPPPQMLGGGSIPAARHIKVVSKLRTSDNPSSLKRPVYQASSSLLRRLEDQRSQSRTGTTEETAHATRLA